ncbi:MAG TPA: CHAD domain-containing protein [Geobacteraceae bacterium]|nr:CHAD domain-containing protein [Geobacteraceae bacterium]
MQVEGTTPLWIAARILLSEREEDFFRRRDKALKTSDQEDIHDLRVSSRRLREGLALFALCYPAGNIARLVRQMKQVTRLLGEIRNADEAILFFTALAEELDADHRDDLERISDTFRKGRKKEMKRLKSGLKEIAAGAPCDLYRRVIHSPSLFNRQKNDVDLFVPLSQFAGEALNARLAAVLRLLPEARQAGEMEAQHLLRIAVKHFRYRMEILSFLFGAHYEELHGVLKAYQDLLGKMHDLDVFAAIVRKAGLTFLTQKPLLDAIAAKRGKLFADFSAMLETTPLKEIGERMRTIL